MLVHWVFMCLQKLCILHICSSPFLLPVPPPRPECFKSKFLVCQISQKCINRFQNHVWNFQLLKYILNAVMQPWACLKYVDVFCLSLFVFDCLGLTWTFFITNPHLKHFVTNATVCKSTIIRKNIKSRRVDYFFFFFVRFPFLWAVPLVCVEKRRHWILD